MDILILGSTLLTELSIEKIKDSHNIVGYVPSINPTVEGDIKLPIVDENIKCDIKLSIQYDKIIKNTRNCFNVHTGLLPEYGGTNILTYSIMNRAVEQGLTFHKMTKDLDYGPIISKTTYPVLPGDTSFDLFERLLLVGPNFILSCLNLLETLSEYQINKCYKKKPTIYKRGYIQAEERIKNYERRH